MTQETTSPNLAIERVLPICNEKGLHARASAKFAETAHRFDADIRVTRDQLTVSALSIMGLLMLAAAKGCTIDVSTSGKDAGPLMEAIAALIDNKFGEGK